jgi:hypothetical protein
LLRARLVLGHKKSINPAELHRRLKTPEARQAIHSLIRKLKSERVGIALADISVCGAIPPYSALLGGKLVAMLLTSPEIIMAYRKRYSAAESVIASSIAGRPIVRDPHLVLLGTTSLYGSEPNQYTRVTIPCSELGASSSHTIRYELLGRTEGYGTFQFSDETVDALSAAVAQYRGGRRVNSIFGEGVNPRLRKIRDGLDLLGLDSDALLLHGNARLIYGVPLALNFREYLLGREAVPQYPFDCDHPQDVTSAIASWWTKRWLLRRIVRDDVLREVSRHRLTYPVTHGARVILPEDSLKPRLNFGQAELGSFSEL